MRKRTAPKLLADALIELSKHKSLEKITIREIVEQCGLSSQTFYNHFSDKYALILWIHQSKGQELLQQYESGEISFQELCLENLKFYKAHATFMKNALSNTHGPDSYRVQSSENAIREFEACIKRTYPSEAYTTKEEIHLRMYVYSATEIYAYWIMRKPDMPIEEICEHLISGMPESLHKFLK